MRALVTGANGALSPSLISFLIRGGWDVHALVRQPYLNIFDDTPVKVFIGDITNPESMKDAFKEIDVVFHLAALLHIANPSERLAQAYYITNVKGTENVLSIALREKVQRVVFFSTIAVYGEHSSSIFTENTSPRPETNYGRTKLTAEELVLSSKKDDGNPLGTILRLGAVYGSHVKGNYRRLLHSLAHGRFIPIGRGENRRTLVHEKDVARAAILAANHPATPGNIFNVTDGHFHTVDEIITTICNASGSQTTPSASANRPRTPTRRAF